MQVLILTPYYEPGTRGGGPIRTLTALVKAAPADVRQSVFTRSRDLGEVEDYVGIPCDEWTPRGRAEVFYASGGTLQVLRSLFKVLRLRRANVLYLNSIFHPWFALVPQILTTVKLGPSKVLVAPRGELGEGALSIKWPKKRVALAAYRAFRWPQRVIWHASSELEKDDILRVFPKVDPARIRVSLDETDLPTTAAPAHEPHKGAIRIVFVSRIVPKKGLDVLLTALSEVSEPVSLRIVGPLEDPAYEAKCRELLPHIDLRHQIEFVGALAHAETVAEFENADLFAFPTANENFGHVIAEAMAMSCPVILPNVTPWTRVLPAHWISATRESKDWAGLISAWAESSPQERAVASQLAHDTYQKWQESLTEPHIFATL